MKKLFFLVVLLVTTATASFAQQAKVIAFINKASWCPVCKANGPRFEKDIMPMAMAGPLTRRQILILMHDHQAHHIGQLIVYLRLKGIKPPGYVGW